MAETEEVEASRMAEEKLVEVLHSFSYSCLEWIVEDAAYLLESTAAVGQD